MATLIKNAFTHAVPEFIFCFALHFSGLILVCTASSTKCPVVQKTHVKTGCGNLALMWVFLHFWLAFFWNPPSNLVFFNLFSDRGTSASLIIWRNLSV